MEWTGRRCHDVYKAVLHLPENLSSLTHIRHHNAFYRAGESSEFSADQLMSQLIDETTASNGYLDVNFLIHRRAQFEIRHTPSRASRRYCANVLYEIVTAKFNNGLSLQSEDTFLKEVPMENCDQN